MLVLLTHLLCRRLWQAGIFEASLVVFGLVRRKILDLVGVDTDGAGVELLFDFANDGGLPCLVRRDS
jgi:hypothetical protein